MQDVQAHLDTLYRRLDELRAEASARLAQPGGDPALRSEHAARLARYQGAEERLCFGRLDLIGGGTRYIGRLGLTAPDGDEPLLIDWRAPAARPFYAATAAEPMGVRRRLLISTAGRRVTAVDEASFTGPPGRLRDVVATLRAEQDAIIRSDHEGILVVQGGPGTGKTVVALHRAAYLLYHRLELAGRGVLVVGPSEIFLDHIGQVLPGLGETGVVTATVAGLLPGVTVTRSESPSAASRKGALAMADRLPSAVRHRQAVVPVSGFDPDDLRYAATRARASGLPHNPARRVFTTALAARLTDRAIAEAGRQDAEIEDALAGSGVDEAVARDLADLGLADATGADDSRVDPEALRRSFARDPAVLAATAACWPVLTPGDLVPATGGGWTAADIPLLDEAAELLGYDFTEPGANNGTVAERATRDRRWTYGHVIVDEAQELSPMAWRMVLRRAPGRSMTVAGDVGQTSDPAGADDWAGALRPHVGDRWREARLTVNYRTPAEIMDAAAGLRPSGDRPVSVRSSGVPPWRIRTTRAELPALLARLVAEEPAGGRVAVIRPDDCRQVLDLPRDVVVLGARQAKGLEFDVVLIGDPAAILAASPRGRQDLYVAMTRATQRLGVVHPGPAPAELSALVSRPSAPTSAGVPPRAPRSGTSPAGTADG